MQYIRVLHKRVANVAKICSKQNFPATYSKIFIMVKSGEPKAQKPDHILIRREMTITRTDFFRLLPKALASYKFKISDSSIQVTMETGVVIIRLLQETTRKVGAMELPVTHITFNFENTSDEEMQKFFEKFDLVYQKGGG